MFNIVRTIYGTELFRAGPNGSATDRICTCDDQVKAARLITWLTALNSITPLDKVLELQAQPPKPQLNPKCCHGRTTAECDSTCTDTTSCKPPA